MQTSFRVEADYGSHAYYRKFLAGEKERVNALSVTEVLRAVGAIDAQFCSEEARARGAAVHEAIRLHFKGTLDESSLHEKVRPFYEAFLKMKARLADFFPELLHGDEFDCRVEEALYLPDLGLVGRADLRIVRRDPFPRQLALLDWKSGKLQWWAGLQLAGYDILQQGGRPPRSEAAMSRYGVELDPESPLGGRIVPFKDFSDYDDFLAALRTVRRLEREGIYRRPSEEVDL